MDQLDLLIVHQFDPTARSAGGIDTCIHGILKYHDHDKRIGLIGVMSNAPTDGIRMQEWNEIEVYGRPLQFLPVSILDPGDLSRRMPYSARIVAGTLRHRISAPSVREVQAHRADTALAVRALWPRTELRYFIHTQESGIVSSGSDSIWKAAAPAHRTVEQLVIRTAQRVRVFNPQYGAQVAGLNDRTKSMPTWWDPEYVLPHHGSPSGYTVLWAGRIEQPKNLELAVRSLGWLQANYPEEPWHITVCGDGVQKHTVEVLAENLGVRNRMEFLGRITPQALAIERSRSDVMLMTSVPGYEGFPRVLTEGLASGLPAVVTDGCDTGHLIEPGVNGFVSRNSAESVGSSLRRARLLSSQAAMKSVASISARQVVAELYAD